MNNYYGTHVTQSCLVYELLLLHELLPILHYLDGGFPKTFPKLLITSWQWLCNACEYDMDINHHSLRLFPTCTFCLLGSALLQ